MRKKRVRFGVVDFVDELFKCVISYNRDSISDVVPAVSINVTIFYAVAKFFKTKEKLGVANGSKWHTEI